MRCPTVYNALNFRFTECMTLAIDLQLYWSYLVSSLPQETIPPMAPTLLHCAALQNQTAVVEWLQQRAYPPHTKCRRILDLDGRVHETTVYRAYKIIYTLQTNVHVHEVHLVCVCSPTPNIVNIVCYACMYCVHVCLVHTSHVHMCIAENQG